MPGSLTPRAATASGASQAGSDASKGPQAGGASPDGSTARPEEAHQEERLPTAGGCRTPKGITDAEATGSCSTPSSVPGIGEAPCGQGVDLLWPQSEPPVVAKRSGKEAASWV